MPWPDFFAHISAMTRSASSVVAGAGPHRTAQVDLGRANRQLRSWPSAVSRTRSQLPQNGAGDAGDDAHRLRAAVDEEQLGRGTSPLPHRG